MFIYARVVLKIAALSGFLFYHENHGAAPRLIRLHLIVLSRRSKFLGFLPDWGTFHLAEAAMQRARAAATSGAGWCDGRSVAAPRCRWVISQRQGDRRAYGIRGAPCYGRRRIVGIVIPAIKRMFGEDVKALKWLNIVQEGVVA